MNKVFLSGNICKNIELKFTTNNVPVLSNAIAVKSDYKNKEGKYVTQFINFVAYRNQAEFLNKYADKGSKVLIEGKWNVRKYTKIDGTIQYISELIVEQIELLSYKKVEQNLSQSSDPIQDDPFESFGEEITIRDEDLPF